MLKKIGIGLAAIVMFFVLVFSWSYFATMPLRSLANDFISLGGQGKIDQAYELTNATFKQNTSITQLEEFFTGTGLGSTAQPEWKSWSRKTGGIGSISGTLDFEGPTTDIVVNFQKEDGDWQISGVSVEPRKE